MGVTYRAWDEVDKRPVVVKMPKREYLDQPGFVERFSREIRAMAALRHPHVVPILDYGVQDDQPFAVMRFLPGGSLDNRRLRDGARRMLPNHPGSLQLWLPAIAGALDFIHAFSVVHRDVKPANIFFDAFWGAFLGDFGLAKILEPSAQLQDDQTLTQMDSALGTSAYMAPERFTPKAGIDGTADQYSLAVIAFELMAGVKPFTGEQMNIVVEVTTRPPPPLTAFRRDLPESFRGAVERGLAKSPAQRFRTCGEFTAALLRDIPPLPSDAGVARFLCPACHNTLKMPVTAGGQTGVCPRCRKQLKVASDLSALWMSSEDPLEREFVEQSEGQPFPDALPPTPPFPLPFPISPPTPVFPTPLPTSPPATSFPKDQSGDEVVIKTRRRRVPKPRRHIDPLPLLLMAAALAVALAMYSRLDSSEVKKLVWFLQGHDRGRERR